VYSARRRYDEALAAFDAEMAGTASGVYAREFRWLAATSAGFHHLQSGGLLEAASAFAGGEALNPGAARGMLGLYLARGDSPLTKSVRGLSPITGETTDRGGVERALDEMASGPKASDATLVRAALLAWTGRRGEACDVLHLLLNGAPPGPTAWNLAADPMFSPLHSDHRLRSLLVAVAARAA
jgi:hypothetical protein